MNKLTLRPMTINDYEQVYAMWRITSSRALSSSDDRAELERFLARNEGISTVAEIDGKIVSTALGGHDGRRGFIYHMAVLPEYRRHGFGGQVARRVIEKLTEQKIPKTHIFVYADNMMGQGFWASQGWQKRDDIYVYAKES